MFERHTRPSILGVHGALGCAEKEPEPGIPFQGLPKRLLDSEAEPDNYDSYYASEEADASGVFAEAIAAVPRTYHESVTRLQQQQNNAALCEITRRVEQDTAERAAAAAVVAAEAAVRAAEPQVPDTRLVVSSAGVAGKRTPGTSAAEAAAACGTDPAGGDVAHGAVQGQEVIDLCDSDEETAAAAGPASKRARTAPKSTLARAPAAPKPPRLSSGPKTVSGTCGVSPLAIARRNATALLGKAAASKPATDDASWMFGGMPTCIGWSSKWGCVLR